MAILILVLVAGLVYFWFVTRPTGNAAAKRSSGPRTPTSARPPRPDDDDDFLREVEARLRARRSDGE